MIHNRDKNDDQWYKTKSNKQKQFLITPSSVDIKSVLNEIEN